MSRRFRRAVVLTLAALAALVLLSAAVGKALGPWALERAKQRFARELGPLDRWTREDPVPAEADNAALALRRAVGALRLTEEDVRRLREVASSPEPPAEAEALRALLARHAEALAWLDEAAARPHSSFAARAAYFGGAPSAEDPSSLLRTARLSTALGRLALAEGDDAGLERALGHLGALAAVLRRERVLVTSFLAGAVERSLYELLWRRAARPGGAELFAAVDRLLRRIESSPGLRDALATEAALSAALLRSRAEQGLDPPQTWGDRLRSLVSPWTAQHLEAELLDTYVDLARALERPPADQPARLRRPVWLRALDVAFPWHGPRWLSSLLIPNLLDSLHKERRLECERRLARLAVDLRLAAARQGAYPDRLPEGPPVALSGERPLFVRTPDGGAELSLPGAEARIRQELAGLRLDERDAPSRQLAAQAARMTWRLPPAGLNPVAGE